MSERAPTVEATPRRRLAISGTNAGLGALLVALVVVFTLVIGENFFSTGVLRSMALQMPELGILSLAMMFRYTFARADIADRIDGAVRAVLAAGKRTGDIALPGEATIGTRAMGDAVVAALQRRA